MKRLLLVAVAALSACSDQEVGQSVYFEGPYRVVDGQVPRLQAEEAERARIRAQIAEQQAMLDQQRSSQARQDALVASIETAIDQAGQRVGGTATMPSVLEPQPQVITQLPQTAVQPQQAQQTAPQPGSSAAISDNSFASVTARESIESDAERLARLQQGTVVLEAEPVPDRANGPNLAAFARSTTHKVGQRIYRRSGGRSGDAARTCRRYGNPDEAQRAFLSRGGPERDDMGIDPDGDGFVCGWTPDQFRNLRVGG